jgi:hypothetical protein
LTTESRSRGNKRSKTEMLKIEQKIRDLMYSENPRYTDEQILEILQIPKRTDTDTNPRFGEKTNQKEKK